MLSNYLKILFRNIVRNKAFTFINITGLAAGLTCALLIGLYVSDELSFESNQKNLDRICLVYTEATWDGKTARWTGVPNLVAPTAAREIPEVEKAARLFAHDFGNIAFVSTDTVKSSEKLLAWADQDIFSILTYEFIKGNQAQALVRPNTAVISEAAAIKYFGTTEVLGKSIVVDNADHLEITGVFKNPPATSRFQNPIIASFNSHYFAKDTNLSWSNASFETWLLLKEDVKPVAVEQKMADMVERNIVKDERWFSLHLLPLRDVYLRSGDVQSFGTLLVPKGDIQQVRILIGLALIIIVVAAVNYMNLSTAQSQRRFKEIGVTKTMGATSSQLARRFYLETFVFVGLALLISVLISLSFLPFFNTLTGKQLSMGFLTHPSFWGIIVIIWLLLSMLSGVYPALYLSSFLPQQVLKGSSSGSGGSPLLRRVLVVVQFSVSIILIISTAVFYEQLSFIRQKKLGYNPEQVVAILTSGAQNKEQVSALQSELSRVPGVLGSVRSQAYPGESGSGRVLPPLNGNGEGKALMTVRTSGDVLEVLGIKLLAGRSLPEAKAQGDTTIQVVLNKTATDFLGKSPDDLVGMKLKVNGFGPLVEVAGVMEDFHFSSMHDPIGAYCFHNAPTESFNYLLVKLDTRTLQETMHQVENTYLAVIPTTFEYTFLDQRLAVIYHKEEQMAQVIMLFSGLAIIIACLGLYALAAYTTEQRTREIGIRKVLGASVSQLSSMLSMEFVRLVVISFVIASPAAWYLMNRWLEGFAYRVNINVLVVGASGLLAVMIAWFTVSLESFKAARSNPVQSLRRE